MTSIYRPQMGQRGPLAAPSSPLVPQGTQQPAPYKPAPVAPGINFNPPQQPAAPMLPGQQAQPAVRQLGNSIVNEGYAKPAVMPIFDQYGELTASGLDQMNKQRQQQEMLDLKRIQLGMPSDIPFEKPMPIPEKYATPYSPDDQGYMPNPGRGGFSPGAEPMPGRGGPMPGMGGRGFGRQQMMMQQQQMMRQIQMLQQMMQQQMMQRQMRQMNRGRQMPPAIGLGPDVNNFQEPANGNSLYSDGPGFAVYKKGGTVKEKKMAMGGMGGPMDRMGLAPQPRQMPMPPKMAAANQAEAMGLLKGAIGAPGGVAGGTMKNALAALKGMKKGGKVEEAGMVGKEVAFMKKKGAPKSMVKHEEAEMGEKKPMYMAFKKNGQPDGMKPVSGYARGGGIESKGKTKGKIVKMASGGMVGHASARADGCAQRGKTKGKMR